MQKRLRRFGRISFGFRMAEIILTILIIALQPLLRVIYQVGLDWEEVFVVPWNIIIILLLKTGIHFIFLYVILNHGNPSSIAAEIVSIVILCGILPLLSPVFYSVYYMLTSSVQGVTTIAAHSIISSALSWLDFISVLSTAFYCIFCGMSIAVKTDSKLHDGLVGDRQRQKQKGNIKMPEY